MDEGTEYGGASEDLQDVLGDVECGSHHRPSMTPDDDITDITSGLDNEEYCLAGVRGLSNLGNTCYMNATFQALAHLPPVTDYFLKCTKPPSAFKRIPERIGEELSTLVHTLWKEDSLNAHHSPNAIVHSIKSKKQIFNSYDQQDAQEFLTYLLEELDSEFVLKPSRNKRIQAKGNVPDRSVIQELFAGYTKNTIKCLECEQTSDSDNRARFDLLMVQLPQQTKQQQQQAPSKGMRSWMYDSVQDTLALLSLENILGTISLGLLQKPQNSLSLDECLEAYFAVEIFDRDNQYNCDHCKCKRDAERVESITSLPKVLTVMLKRFEFDTHATKNDRHVSFPINNLDVSKFVSLDASAGVKHNTRYHLHALICHVGRAWGGHYYAIARNYADGRWYIYNDSTVTEVEESRVAEHQPYVLFYHHGAFPAQASQHRLRVQEYLRSTTATTTATTTTATTTATATTSNSIPSSGPNVWVSRRWWVMMLTSVDPGPIDNTDFMCVHDEGVIPHLSEREKTKLAIQVPCVLCLELRDGFGGDVCPSDLTPCSKCEQTLVKLMQRRKREREIFDAHLDFLEKFHRDQDSAMVHAHRETTSDPHDNLSVNMDTEIEQDMTVMSPSTPTSQRQQQQQQQQQQQRIRVERNDSIPTTMTTTNSNDNNNNNSNDNNSNDNNNNNNNNNSNNSSSSNNSNNKTNDSNSNNNNNNNNITTSRSHSDTNGIDASMDTCADDNNNNNNDNNDDNTNDNSSSSSRNNSNSTNNNNNDDDDGYSPRRSSSNTATSDVDIHEPEIFYAVSLSWYRAWRHFLASTSLDDTPPGAIENKDLINANGTIRSHINHEEHFVLFPAPLWRLLHDRYRGGPILCWRNLQLQLISPNPRKIKRRRTKSGRR